MKALVYSEGRLRLSERPPPEPAPGEAFIRVLCAGICNTDLEITRGYLNFEGILGHEFVGVVEQDSGAGLSGKRVVGEVNLPCYGCSRCRSGLMQHCLQIKALGMRGKDGAFAEYITLPVRNLHLVPDVVSNEQAVFVEPAAAALRIAEQYHLRPSERVLVLGDGKLGLTIARVLDAIGLEVEVLGRNAEKLATLQDIGVASFRVSREDGSILEYTGDRARAEQRLQDVPVVVEATGTQAGLEAALRYVQPEGKLILKSTVAAGAKLNLSPAVVNEVELLGSRCGPFAPVLRMMERGRLNLAGMVSARYPLEHAEEAFEAASERGALKILIDIETAVSAGHSIPNGKNHSQREESNAAS